MRIVIDLQGAQGENRYRGIGRYSLSLAKAIIQNRGEHEIIIALNGLFSDTIEPIRAALDSIISQENIRVWHTPFPASYLEPSNKWRRKAGELAREAFLISLQPDIIHITSLFEGLVDDAVTSVGLFSQSTATAVTLYDLIPLINKKPYLDNPVVESWYRSKLDQLKRADLVLAISESTRQESIKHLGFSDKSVINVGTAADSQFQRINVSKESERAVRERYGLTRQFVMYTGGIDHRKNIDGLIRSFALLPKSVRRNHQLAIICSVQPESRRLLEQLAARQGLDTGEIILTGFVPEEDLVALYHICKVFIFPSWHEGFGLPALEAMSCGAAVIGANASSLPEVIGREDALFNPHDDQSIAEKLAQVLGNNSYREELIGHGLLQAKKFSWRDSGKRAIAAFEQFYAAKLKSPNLLSTSKHRPKLAYISPLPPGRSGIADYSAALLPELSQFYDIDVVINQEAVSDAWILDHCSIRSVKWFSEHADIYERVVYHFGNSDHHQYMFDLLARIPGVVVLHDFFLSGIVAHMEVHGFTPNGWTYELYRAHNYKAVQERFAAKDTAEVVWKYPCNKTVVENALGIIVHSMNSRNLAEQWLGSTCAKDWSVIPLLRVPAIAGERVKARLALNLDDDALIVCSFGLLGPSKQNHRLLDAWLSSSLAKNERCSLIFVGENDGGEYGRTLTEKILSSGLSDRIRITGWTDSTQFQNFLIAANIGVQLRAHSRGETSAAVLDCMNYGLPTIVNANGSMADLSADNVLLLRDEFNDAELKNALELLANDKRKSNIFSTNAREVIKKQNSPRMCASQYAQSIEKYYEKANSGAYGLVKKISRISNAPTDNNVWLELAKNINQNLPLPADRQLFIDISELVQRDSKSGIQRVVRSILSALLINPPKGFRVEPVYAKLNEAGYFYARQFTLRFLNCPDQVLSDGPIEVFNGDIFLGLDLQPHVVPQQTDFYAHLKRVGVQLYFVVYDLLPISLPSMFADGAATTFAAWINTIAQSDGVICISRASADELIDWLTLYGPRRLRSLRLGWFHLGADLAGSIPTVGLPSDSSHVFREISKRPTFLVIGTLEPRKGQAQTLAAFEALWEQRIDVNLVFVGKQGWMVEKLIAAIRTHPAQNRRLFWLESASDEYLEKIYAASTCLIAASEGEGFGLPLIEAAQHKLPIIARDLPVFREVAGEHAFYFSGLTPSAMTSAIKDWLALNTAGKAPPSDTMPWLTWAQSSQQLINVVLKNTWLTTWMPDGGCRYFGSDSRLSTQVGKQHGLVIQTTGVEGYLLHGPYLELAAGQYQIKVYGQVLDSGTPSAYVDIAVQSGSQILQTNQLSASTQLSLIAEIGVFLKTAVTDLEVRIWVGKNSELTINRLEILPNSLFGEEVIALSNRTNMDQDTLGTQNSDTHTYITKNGSDSVQTTREKSMPRQLDRVVEILGNELPPELMQQNIHKQFSVTSNSKN
jgi:glycosyltransferase involved in cell wall biosynthesis